MSPYVDPASSAVCTTPPPDEPSAMEITASQSVIIEINDTIMNNLNKGQCKMIIQYSWPALHGYSHYVAYLCCFVDGSDSVLGIVCH